MSNESHKTRFEALHQGATEGRLLTALTYTLWRFKVFVVVTVLLLGVGCDQATKHWAQSTLAEERTEARFVVEKVDLNSEYAVNLKQIPSTSRIRVRLDEDVKTQGPCRISHIPPANLRNGRGYELEGAKLTLVEGCAPIDEGATLSVTYPVVGLAHAHDVIVIKDAFHFRYAENRSAAFGFTSSIPAPVRRWLLVGLNGFALLLLLTFFFRLKRPDGLLQLALLFLACGAIGNNLLDRARLGYVVDFIDWRASFINPAWSPWPTFNIADMFVVLAAMMLFYRGMRPLYPDAQEENDNINLVTPLK